MILRRRIIRRQEYFPSGDGQNFRSYKFLVSKMAGTSLVGKEQMLPLVSLEGPQTEQGLASVAQPEGRQDLEEFFRPGYIHQPLINRITYRLLVTFSVINR